MLVLAHATLLLLLIIVVVSGFEVLVTYSEHINIWPTSHCGQISWSLCYNYLFNLVVSLSQPSRNGRGGGLPIVGSLNCGPTCKANSNVRPQTDLRFARILSVWVGRWGRVRAISRMRWSCAERATASRPRTFFFANTYLFFIIDFLVHGNTSPKF